jgi:predicted ATPase
MQDLMGTVIGNRYRILGKLGEGGMGVVYQAVDRLNRQPVALKRVIAVIESSETPSQAEPSTTATRVALANEFQMLASLHHPHIIQVLDYGFDDERHPYFTMNLLQKSRPITAAVQDKPDKDKIRLLVQVLQALAYLHQHGIVHRDLKPDNALVTEEGEVKLLDFGLAVLRDQQKQINDEIAGTVAYMAPEIFYGVPPSTLSDLYAVGVMAYELFAGRHPFDVTTGGKLVNDILYAPVDADMLDVDDHTKAVLKRLLEKSPDRRYSDAYSVITELTKATGQAIPLETKAIRESFLQAARFVGREEQIALLDAALTQVMNGAGSAWLIGGESGAGKSRLLDELRTRALVRGALVLNGQGVAGGGVSYQLWREPLRRLALSTQLNETDAAVLAQIVPDIGELLERAIPPAPELEGQTGQERLISTITKLFYPAQQPIVLILEDLQWAEESLTVLESLLPTINTLPLLIIGSYRNDERPDLPERLPGMQVIKLERLSEASIAALAVSMLGDTGGQPEVLELLKRETEGNVFFLVEVVRALIEQAGSRSAVGAMPLPRQVFAGGIQQVVENRLQRMPAYARPLLNIAAVAGRLIDLNLLRALADGINLDEWLTLCSNLAVVDVMDERWRFAHDKLREGILSSIPADERKQLHWRVAAALETVYADTKEEYAAIIADHYEAAGEWSQTLDWSLRAGKHAETTFAPVMAITYYRKALALRLQQADRQPAPLMRPVEIYERLGELLNWQARYVEAVEAFTAMRTIAEASGDVKTQAGAWYGIARTQTYQGNMRDALESASRSEELARSAGDRLQLAQALWMKGWIFFRLGELQMARTLAEEVLALVDELDMESLKGNSLNLLGAIHIQSGFHLQALDYFQGALEIFQKLGDRLRSMTIINNLGWLAETRGDYRTAFSRYQDALSIARATGHRDAEMVYLSNLGGAQVMLGDYTAAEINLRQVIDMAGTAGLGVLSETYRMLAEACLPQGKVNDALHAARQALAHGQQVESSDYTAAAWRVLGLVAARLAAPIQVAAETDKSQFYHAAACFAESLRICEENGIEAERARTLRDWAQYKLSQDAGEDGLAMWQEAREIFVRLGADWEVERMPDLPSQRPS